AGIAEEDEQHAAAQRMLAGLAWFGAELDGASGEAAQRLLAARQKFLAKDYDGAMQEVLASATADREFLGGLARKAMLLCFAVVGEEDERLDDYRRRLATLLY
ncbi:MAG: tetratricopeptide repeat protein, partial [Planctomycetes bacterium]|nr:tetratricopeptide repeat protein [Planctomycetota bacterium]